MAIGAALAAWIPVAATAGGNGAGTSAAEQWDDSHMQSNFYRGPHTAPPRPLVQGSNRFDQIRDESAEAPRVGVPETVLEISPHEWQRGPSVGAGASGPLSTRDSAPSASGARPSRGSALRGGSVSNRPTSGASVGTRRTR
jgi:hypothetical protein